MWLTRRGFFPLLAGFALAKNPELPVLPPEWVRFADPTTDWEVFRLTNPEYACHLPMSSGRIIARNGSFLLFWSDRSGSRQVYRMDLKTGQAAQLTQAEALDGQSIALTPDDRNFCYSDRGAVRIRNFGSLGDREIGRVSEGWSCCPGPGLSRDGQNVAFAEARGKESRLRLVHARSRRDTVVGELPFVLEFPQVNPRREQILYRQDGEALWLVNFDGQQNRKLRTASGTLGPALWRPDGRTVIYLRFPEEANKLYELREHTPDENSDKLISATSQFVHFGVNSDGSVFAGASKNLNSPHILLLLRTTRRELTVCEHRASDPRQVAPVFSPNNRFLFFESDKDGKPAIYRVRVEKFVEPVEENT